jgi:hypothetical protein
VLYSADPGKKLGLRMEVRMLREVVEWLLTCEKHTHCALMDGRDVGGRYHGDVEGEEVEYEGYFNVARTLYRVEKPEVTLERDLHE